MQLAQNAGERALAFEGNALVEAGPGTGKTHLIAAKAAGLVRAGVDPKRILVLTFSRRAAAELRERLERDGAAGCEVRTFHGFASRVLEAGGPRFRSRRLLGAFADAQLLDAAIAATTLRTIDAHTRGSERFRADAARFSADLQRNERSSVAQLRATATPRIADLVAIADAAAALRETVRASDIGDLIARAVGALDDPASPQSAWLAERYAHVLVDEFQDVDRLQLRLCERVGATVFAVGDPAQSIYRFRGATSGIFAEGARRLGLEPFALEESRRCPQLICDLAARTPLVGAKPLRSLVEAPGSISVRSARTTLDEAALIADRIEDALADGTPSERIAVLVRSMQPLGRAVVAELAARRIPAVAAGSDAFCTDADITTLRFALRALAEPERRDAWAAFLAAPCLGLDASEVRLSLARQTFASAADASAWLRASAFADAIAIEHLAMTIDDAAERFAAGSIGNAVRRLVRGLRLIERHARASDTVAARTAIARITRFVDALAETQTALAAAGNDASSARVTKLIDDHVDELGSDETPPDDARGVRVLTIHGAKGLQFDLVVLGDAVDGKLPAQARPSTLLDAADREALAAAGVDVVDGRADDGSIEEASLWYVALTRVRRDLVITYAVQGADGTPQRVSRFLPPDLHLPDTTIPFERTRERIERTLAASDEVAAHDALAVIAQRSPIVAAIVANGDAAFDDAPDRPVAFDRAFSVSAAETWLRCPRRFYYAHGLRLRGDENNAMKGGSLLHAILERFHREYASFGPTDPRPVDAWLQRLYAIRRELSAGDMDGPLEIRKARGIVLDRMLRSYVESLASDAEREPFRVLAVEAEIVATLGGGSLRGKLDRIDERTAGGLVLRDYKTGNAHATFAKDLAGEFAGDETLPEPGAVASDYRTQIALYRAASEARFGKPVVRLEYLYLKGKDADYRLVTDSITVDDTTLPVLERLDRYVGERFVDGFADGVASPVKTAIDVQACRFCDFRMRRVCDGPA